VTAKRRLRRRSWTLNPKSRNKAKPVGKITFGEWSDYQVLITAETNAEDQCEEEQQGDSAKSDKKKTLKKTKKESGERPRHS
jgi:hypothetical protein